MIKLLEERPILTIILVVAAMLLPVLDVLEVSIMEARNFIAAREMLTDGNWILTTMNGEPRYQKPPLPTWLSAISATVFGIKSVWGMRFPAVLMVMLLGSIVYMLSRKLTLTKQHSLINGLVSVTSLYVVLIVFEAPWDIYAHAFMIAGIYQLYCYLNPTTNRDTPEVKAHLRKGIFITGKIHLIVASLCIGASILSKGPVSLYVLLVPFLITYLVVFGKETAKAKWMGVSLSLTMGLIIGFCWYAYVRYADPLVFAAITKNETGNWTSYNVRPFYYYWSFFVQSGLWTIPAFVSLIYPYMKTRVCNPKVYRFTLLWTLLAVVLLSVIPEKKSRYLMPVLIPLAITAGFYLEYLVRKFREMKDWREVVPVYFNFGLIGLAFILGTGYIVYEEGFHLLFMITGLVGGICVLLLLKRKKLLSVLYIIPIILGILGIAGLSISLPARISTALSVKDMQDLPSDLPLYSLTGASPTMVWEYGSMIPRITESQYSGSESLQVPKEDRFLVLESQDSLSSVAEFFKNSKVIFLKNLDINTVAEDNRNFKQRKTAKVFLVEK